MAIFKSGYCNSCRFGLTNQCFCQYIKDVDLETYCVSWADNIEEATDFSESASYTLTMMGYKKSSYEPSITEKIYTKPRYMGIIIRNI